VVGRTSDGGVIYADGRIVYPDGTVVYTSNNGRTMCRYDGYGVPCGRGVRAYRVARGHEDEARRFNDEEEDEDEGHDHGHHYGWYKHHHQGGQNQYYGENQGGDGGD